MKFPHPKTPTPVTALPMTVEILPGQGVSAADRGMAHDMMVRGAVLLAGVVAVIVGVVGLLTPVSMSPERENRHMRKRCRPGSFTARAGTTAAPPLRTPTTPGYVG